MQNEIRKSHQNLELLICTKFLLSGNLLLKLNCSKFIFQTSQKKPGMARASLTAAMVGKNVGQRIIEGNLPIYYARYGNTIEATFIEAGRLKKNLGEKFKDLPTGAMGLYTYNQRLIQGLKQLMCGARKFAVQHITRDDIAALTPEAARVLGINYVIDADKEEVEKILS